MSTSPLNLEKLSRSQLSRLFAIALREPDDTGDDLACEIADTIHDRRQLNQLVADLKSPVISADRSPLSFQRVTGISDEQAQSLAGQSLMQALTSVQTSREALKALRDYGRLLSQPMLPKATQATGAVVLACAQALLFRRFDVAMEAGGLRYVEKLLRLIAETAELPKPLRDCAAQSTSNAEPAKPKAPFSD